MELQQIKSYLASPNPQNRMKALVELRHHDPEVVVPLLKQRMYDKEFVVRSFVAMGLGNKQTDEGFDALLSLIENDHDSNVVAEAANSLAKFGDRAYSHLIKLFERNSHWLVRQSIFAVLGTELLPESLLWICRCGFEGEDLVVQHASLSIVGRLQGTPQEPEALEILLEAATADAAMLRAQAARSLQGFEQPQAQAALRKLRQDANFQVVGAALESLL
ncbi:MAG: HEAT repeat domain-containing protein [Leptolyngbya sp. SIO1D8]|nr:HEAT repeat domain-containing protein [Leptolyngbya sp. SIO1D8]